MTKQLVAGVYRLRHAVINPGADRRHRHDWSKVEGWAAGTEVVVESFTREVDEDVKKTFTWIEIQRVGGRGKLGPGHAAFEAFVAALDPAVESVPALFTRLGVRDMSLHRFLQWAVESERIGRRAFEEMFMTWLDTPDPDEETT